MGALSRLQKQVREVLSPYDLMIVLGADPLRMSVYSEVDPLPDGLGIVQIGLAYILITGGIPHVPALEATLLLFLEPALNPIWAWLVLRERPGPWALAGGAIILLTTAIKARSDAR